MFVLIESEKRLKSYLIDMVLSIEGEIGLFQLDVIGDATKHIKAQYMPRFPALVCIYTANLRTGEEYKQQLLYTTCTRSMAKKLVYKTTNTLSGLAWKLCNNQGEYYEYRSSIAEIKNVRNNDIIPPTNELYMYKGSPSAMLVTYVTYPEPYGRRIMRFFTLTLQEAKSLVYFEKNKKMMKTTDNINRILDSYEAKQRVTENFGVRMAKKKKAKKMTDAGYQRLAKFVKEREITDRNEQKLAEVIERLLTE